MTVEAWHVVRTVRALELLAVAPRSAPELAAGMQVHVRTARRMLRRLESEGYVALRDERRRRYRPTMRIVAVAGQVVERAELTQTAVPHVAALRGELGEACHLCVPSYLSALCLCTPRRAAASAVLTSVRWSLATARRPARRCWRGASAGAKRC